MKFLFVIEPSISHTSGVSVCYRNLIKYLLEMNHQVMLLTPDNSYVMDEIHFSVPGITLFPFAYPNLKFIVPSARLFALAMEFDPDVIHVPLPGICSMSAKLLKFLLKKPLVTGCLHTDIEGMIDMYGWTFMKWILQKYFAMERKMMDKVLYLNSTQVDTTNGVLWKMGVDRDLFYPKTSYSLNHKILIANRIAKEKNIDFVLEVGRITLWADFIVCGEGPMLDYMKRKASSNFVFMGCVSHSKVADLMRSSDVVLCPGSREINLPLTMLEAFACGTPVIAIKDGGMACTETPAIMYEKDRSPYFVRSLIENLLRNEYKRKKIGEESVQFSRSYDWKHSAIQFLQIHQSFLEQN